MTVTEEFASRGSFRILAVCTGNICRSPATELLLRRSLGSVAVVESAGTGALVGAAMDPRMACLLEADGLSTDGFKARMLTEELVHRANLILALTRTHRAQVVEMVPGAVRRTFTLREFAALLEPTALASAYSVPASMPCLEAGVVGAAAQRVRSALGPTEYDVPDPYQGSVDDFRSAWRLVRESTEQIAASMTNFAGRPHTAHSG